MGCAASKQKDGATDPRSVARKATAANPLILGYWDMRGAGRGNPTRFILNYAGVPYEEKTYVAGSGDWQAQKDGLGMDFPNLPYIIDGDLKLSETVAIQMYIAQKYKPELLGANAAEAALVSRLVYLTQDIFLNAMKAIFPLDSPEWMAPVLHEKMLPLVKHLGQKSFLNGEQVCVADFVLFEMCELLYKLQGDDAWAHFPTLQPYHARIAELPGMKEFYESDRMVRAPFLPAKLAKVKI